MSGRICRETYANYGSYLRSRGYDKAFCDLIEMIVSGKIPVGPLWPVDKCNAILNGTGEIIECDGKIPGPGTGGVQSGMGQLWVQGGYSGSSSGPALARDLSIQAANGINTGGAIIQNAPANSTVVVPNVGQITDQNYLESNTYLDGGLTMNALPSTSGVVLTPPKSVITDIINSNSSTSLPAAWSNGSIPDFPNDYTLATTKAIHDYVAGIAGVTHLSYNENNNANPAPQVHLTNEVFKIKGDTIAQTAPFSSSPAIITEAQNNQELIIDLTKTGVTAGTYGDFTTQSAGQSIKPIKIHVDDRGRITTASQSGAPIPVMSSFKVTGDTTTGTPAISNSDTLEIVSPSTSNNIECVASSSSNPSGAKVTVSLASTLQNLTDVQTDTLTIPSSNGNSITSILVQGNNANPVIPSTQGGSDQKLATEKAIIDYVTGVNTGFTITDGTNAASINDGDTLTAVDGVNTTALVNIANKRVGWSVNSVLNKMETINGSPLANGYSLAFQSLYKASPSNGTAADVHIALSPGDSTGNGGSIGRVHVTEGYMDIGNPAANAQAANSCLNVGRTVTARSFIGGAYSAGTPLAGEISTQGFSNISSGIGPFTPTATPGDIKVQGEAAIGGDAAIVGDLSVGGDVTIGSGATNTLTINSTTAVPNSNLSNYKVLLIDGNGLVKKSNASADSSTTISSLRYKENVEIMTEEAAADLMKIMPRTFNYKGSNDETFGLIAEELAGTELKAAVANDNEGRPDSINYSMLVAPLLRIVQDQNERIKALEEKVEALSK